MFKSYYLVLFFLVNPIKEILLIQLNFHFYLFLVVKKHFVFSYRTFSFCISYFQEWYHHSLKVLNNLKYLPKFICQNWVLWAPPWEYFSICILLSKHSPIVLESHAAVHVLFLIDGISLPPFPLLTQHPPPRPLPSIYFPSSTGSKISYKNTGTFLGLLLSVKFVTKHSFTSVSPCLTTC